MAIIVPVNMGQKALTTSIQTVYTCGSISTVGKLGLIKTIDVTNTTAGALTVSIFLVPVGGSNTASNALYYATPVAANSVLSWRGTHVLSAGGTIQALASGAGLTINAAGGEYAPTI